MQTISEHAKAARLAHPTMAPIISTMRDTLYDGVSRWETGVPVQIAAVLDLQVTAVPPMPEPVDVVTEQLQAEG